MDCANDGRTATDEQRLINRNSFVHGLRVLSWMHECHSEGADVRERCVKLCSLRRLTAEQTPHTSTTPR